MYKVQKRELHHGNCSGRDSDALQTSCLSFEALAGKKTWRVLTVSAAKLFDYTVLRSGRLSGSKLHFMADALCLLIGNNT